MIDITNIAQVKVRYAETDKMGVVYNGNYFTYFEVGRNELMRNKGLLYTELEKAGFYLPLTESHAKYVKSAIYDDVLDIHARLRWDNSPYLKFEYDIYRKDELICSGYTKHCFQSIETMKPVRPPKVFIDCINNIEKQSAENGMTNKYH